MYISTCLSLLAKNILVVEPNFRYYAQITTYLFVYMVVANLKRTTAVNWQAKGRCGHGLAQSRLYICMCTILYMKHICRYFAYVRATHELRNKRQNN